MHGGLTLGDFLVLGGVFGLVLGLALGLGLDLGLEFRTSSPVACDIARLDTPLLLYWPVHDYDSHGLMRLLKSTLVKMSRNVNCTAIDVDVIKRSNATSLSLSLHQQASLSLSSSTDTL